MDAAEHDLSRTLHKLNDTAQAAGYAPIWPVIVGRLTANLPILHPPAANLSVLHPQAADLPVLHPQAPNLPVPIPQTPPTICPPAGQLFDCVSIPATSRLLAPTKTTMDVYVRPGPKPVPRQDPPSPPVAQPTSAHSAPSDAVGRKRSRKHKRCHMCGTDRSSGGWRGSVLGFVCPTLCGCCYGKEFRRLKKLQDQQTPCQDLSLRMVIAPPPAPLPRALTQTPATLVAFCLTATATHPLLAARGPRLHLSAFLRACHLPAPDQHRHDKDNARTEHCGEI
ncbi:hypothetical protein CF326_g7203 [Tilletia indica]|nr:hypothetical protein CF326_g7203 [Tilletia indica]